MDGASAFSLIPHQVHCQHQTGHSLIFHPRALSTYLFPLRSFSTFQNMNCSYHKRGFLNLFTSRESRSILVTPSHGLFMTIYTKLTLSRDGTKGSMLFFVISKTFCSGFRFVRFTKLSMITSCVMYETFRGIFRVVHEIFWEIVSFLLISRS